MRILLAPLLLLLGCAAPALAQERAQLRTGTIDLPEGFIVRDFRGTDSYPGRIMREDSSFVIHFDIGGMAGTRVTPLRRDAFLWMVEHEVDGVAAYTGMYEEDGKRWIATTVGARADAWNDPRLAHAVPANFTAEATDERAIAEFILVTTSYRPSRQSSAP